MKRRDPNILSKPLQNYYRDLEGFAEQNITHETAVRSAFQNLLADTARAYGPAPFFSTIHNWRFSFGLMIVVGEGSRAMARLPSRASLNSCGVR